MPRPERSLRTRADPLLTYADVSEQLGLSLRTTKQLVYDGRLASVRLSERNIRVLQSAVDAYVARCAEASIYEKTRA